LFLQRTRALLSRNPTTWLDLRGNITLAHWIVLLTSLEGALSPALLYAVTAK